MPCDVVLNGITGSAGLAPTLAALQAGPHPRAGQQGVPGRRRSRWSPGPRDRARSWPWTPSTRRWPSACAAARAERGRPADPHGQRRAVPRTHPRAARRRDARAGAGPPHLGHGPGDHHQLRHPGQQGPGTARGPPALRRRPGPDRRRGAPAVDRALDGAVRRRLDAGPVLPAGHEAADRARPELAGPAARARPGLRLDDRIASWTFEPLDHEAFPAVELARRRAGSAGRRPRCSTPRTRSASTPSTRAGSASCRSSTSSSGAEPASRPVDRRGRTALRQAQGASRGSGRPKPT